MIKINSIRPNPDNPRTVKDAAFAKLKKSIQEFPKMLELRPLVVDGSGMVLGGNMRLKALKELGYKEVPDEWIKRADELTDDEKRRFIIADNVPFGEWNFEELGANWDVEELAEWGLNVPDFDTPADYSLLDDDTISDQMNDLSAGVKKAIQIEFNPDHYDEAFELVKFWRQKGAYVGYMILEFLKAEKAKL